MAQNKNTIKKAKLLIDFCIESTKLAFQYNDALNFYEQKIKSSTNSGKNG